MNKKSSIQNLVSRVADRLALRSDSSALFAEKKARPLVIEALEPRVLFSGSPAPAEPAPAESNTVQESPSPAESDAGADAAPAEEATVAAPPEATVPAPEGAEQGDAAVALTDAELSAITEAAAGIWSGSGISDEQGAALASATYQIADLGGNILGSAEGNVITIDDDAGGRGWFVDATPADNGEFALDASGTLRSTSATGIDLLSVLLHEQGHLLGLEGSGDVSSVMNGVFVEGERRLPGLGQAEGAVAGSLEGMHFATTTSSYIGTNTTNADRWNAPGSWDSGIVPTGDTDVIIPAGKIATAWSASTPTYTGNLTIGNNATLQIGWTTNFSASYNALGTAGSTTITMGDGSLIKGRTSGTYNIPAIVLTGNATHRLGESTQTPASVNYINSITGPHTFTIESNATGPTVNLAAANSFSELIIRGINGRGGNQGTVRATAAGSLGSGNVTITASTTDNRTLKLQFDVSNAMSSSGTLNVGGTGPSGNGLSRVRMNANNTIGGLTVDGLTQAAGTYGRIGNTSVANQVSWIEGDFALTVSPTSDGTWNADADGNWSDTTKWVAGTVADGVDKTATIDNVITADRTITLDTDRTIGNITHTDTTHHTTISGANTLTLDVTSGTPTINVADDEELIISSTIAGNDGLSKTGSGDFRPSGANTFTGGIDLSNGRILIRDDNANEQSFLGDAGNTLTFSGDAALHNVANQVTLPQNITINNGVTGKITGAFAEKTFVEGVLAGSGTLYVQGFSAGFEAEFRNTANTFTGAIEVHSGDSVTLGMASLVDSANTIGLDSAGGNGAKFEYLSNATSPLVLNNRQFELITNGDANTNTSRQPGIVNNAGTANTITINTDLLVTGTGSKKFTLGGGNTGDNTFAGAITDAIGADVLSLYKDNGGKWILSGVNTYEGDTFIQNGTLEIGGAGQLGSGSYAGNISIGNADSFIVNSSADQTLSGDITETSGNGNLTKSNSGTLTIDGSATVNTVSVTAGTLAGSGSISGAVTVASGANLAPGSVAATAGTLSINGALDISLLADGAGTLNFDLDAPGSSDQIDVVGGSASIGSEKLGFSDFNFNELGVTGAGTYTLIATSGGISGTLDSADLTGTFGSLSAALSISGNNIVLTVASSLAAVDDTAAADEDGPAITIDVLANDSVPAAGGILEVDGGTGTVTIDDKGNSDPSDDVLVYDPNGQFEYLQDGQTATDTFTYTVTDNLASASGPQLVAYYPLTATSGLDDLIDDPDHPAQDAVESGTGGSFVTDGTRGSVYSTPETGRLNLGTQGIDLATEGFSWAFWVKTDGNQNADGGADVVIGSRNGIWNKFQVAGMQRWVDIGGYDLDDGDWHHVAIVGDTDPVVSVYIDNAFVGSDNTFFGGNLAVNDKFEFGGSDRFGEDMAGFLSDLSVWKGALSVADIDTLYNGGAAQSLYPAPQEATATVTVTITGANDTPTYIIPTTGEVTEDASGGATETDGSADPGAPALVAHYPFTATSGLAAVVNDTTNLNNTATESGTGGSFVNDPERGSVYSTPEEGRLNLGTQGIDLNTEGFTWSLWVKTDGNQVADSGADVVIGSRSGIWNKFQVNGMARWADIGGYNIDDAAWHHVAIVGDTDPVVSVYIDGAFVGSDNTFFNNDLSVNDPFEAGGSSLFGEDMAGFLSDLAVWNGALSVAQIEALAGGAAPGSIIADPDTGDTHTVAATYNNDANWTGGTLTPAQIAAVSAIGTNFKADAAGWEYNVQNADIQFMGSGETITLSFDITVTDSSGAGTPATPPNEDDSVTQTVTITINGVNDAPTLAGGTLNFDDVPVALADADNAGHTVAYLLDGKAADAETDDAEVGIAITATTFSGAGGSFEYRLDGTTTWVPFTVTDPAAALLLRPEDSVRFQPDGTNSGNGSITFRAWDRTTTESAGQTADASTGGGTTPFSDDPAATATVSVANLVLVGDDLIFTATDGTANDLRVSMVSGELVIVDANGHAIVSGPSDLDGNPADNGIRITYTPGQNLTIETNTADDVITLGDMTGFTGSLTILGGDGFDEVVVANGASVSLGADEDLLVDGETFRADLDSSVSVLGGGTIDILAAGGSGDFAGLNLRRASLSSEGGGITLTGVGGDTGNTNDGVVLTHGSTVSTGGGGVTVTGTATSTTGANDGISLKGGSDITAGGAGGITLTGTSSGVNSSYGVQLFSGTEVTTMGGDIAIVGSSDAVGSRNAGIYTNGATVTAGGAGSVAMTGTGGGAGSNNNGLSLAATAVDAGTSGDVTLVGLGGGGTSGNGGVQVGTGTSVSAGGGNVTITGTGAGTGIRNTGVSLLSGSSVSSGGDTEITGVAGTGTSRNGGVVLTSATVAATGNLTVDGTGNGTGSYNSGISSSGSTLGGAEVMLAGTGSTSSSTGRFNDGVVISKGGVTASGTLTIDAAGGTGSRDNRGLFVSRAVLGGTLALTGSADTGSGARSTGVFIQNSVLSDDGTIEGTGGGVGGADGLGVYMRNITGGANLGVTTTPDTDEEKGGNYFDAVLPAFLLLGAGGRTKARRGAVGASVLDDELQGRIGAAWGGIRGNARTADALRTQSRLGASLLG